MQLSRSASSQTIVISSCQAEDPNRCTSRPQGCERRQKEEGFIVGVRRDENAESFFFCVGLHCRYTQLYGRYRKRLKQSHAARRSVVVAAGVFRLYSTVCRIVLAVG